MLFIFMINLVSAASYNSFSIQGFFNQIAMSDLLIFATFVITFLVFQIPLKRAFVGNERTAVVISMILSLAVSWGVARFNLDLSSLLFGLGIDEEILWIIIPLIILAGLLYLAYKFNVGVILILLGIFILAIAVSTDLIYSEGMAIVLGIIFLLGGVAAIKIRERLRGKTSFIKRYLGSLMFIVVGVLTFLLSNSDKGFWFGIIFIAIGIITMFFGKHKSDIPENQPNVLQKSWKNTKANWKQGKGLARPANIYKKKKEKKRLQEENKKRIKQRKKIGKSLSKTQKAIKDYKKALKKTTDQKQIAEINSKLSQLESQKRQLQEEIRRI